MADTRMEMILQAIDKVTPVVNAIKGSVEGLGASIAQTSKELDEMMLYTKI